MNMKFKPGDIVPATTLESVTGESINLPDPNRLVHLQLRRFGDCPICNTHIAEVHRRARQSEAAGHKKGSVFPSSAQPRLALPKGGSLLRVSATKDATSNS